MSEELATPKPPIKKLAELPTVTPLQVLKHRKRILANPLPFHHENFEKFGPVFRVKTGRKAPVVFTRSAAIIKHVLQKQQKKYEKSPLQTIDLAKYIGHGILTTNGEQWRTHRRMIQPAFHKKKLVGLMHIMLNAIRNEIATIPANKEVDVFPTMGDLAFQVVAQSLFSRADIRKRMAQLKDMTERNQQMLIREMRQPYLKWWFALSGKIKKHIHLAEDARTLLNGIIEERILQEEDKDDLLDMLLSARYEDGTPMPRRQLIDEVLILFAAGHETTANSLSFTLYLLASHQEKQQKAFEEIQRVPWDSENLMDSVMQLPYIKQCIEEAMRLYPPAYIIDRISIEEDELQGFLLPKNTMVLMSIYELHRSAEFWEDADKFQPERFATLDKKAYAEYYYPFGAGPRMCVGNNFAMYEMVMTVAEILRKYKLSTSMKSVTINPLISLKPVRVPLKFTPRA